MTKFPMENCAGHTLTCTMNIVVASSRILTSPDPGLDELFSHAENVMYKAKKFGKNRVISIEWSSSCINYLKIFFHR